MKHSFTTKFKDIKEGDTLTEVVTVELTDLRVELGHKFIFIETEQYQGGDHPIRAEISIPKKSVKRLIRALKEVCK